MNMFKSAENGSVVKDVVFKELRRSVIMARIHEETVLDDTVTWVRMHYIRQLQKRRAVPGGVVEQGPIRRTHNLRQQPPTHSLDFGISMSVATPLLAQTIEPDEPTVQVPSGRIGGAASPGQARQSVVLTPSAVNPDATPADQEAGAPTVA